MVSLLFEINLCFQFSCFFGNKSSQQLFIDLCSCLEYNSGNIKILSKTFVNIYGYAQNFAQKQSKHQINYTKKRDIKNKDMNKRDYLMYGHRIKLSSLTCRYVNWILRPINYTPLFF